MSKSKNLFLSTVFWGDRYFEIFLEYTLNSILTKKNLLDRNNFQNITYLIYTQKKYYKILKSHKNFLRLQKRASIILKPIYLKENYDKYKILTKYQIDSLKIAKKRKEDYYCYIYPDSIFGENHFETLKKKIDQGFKAVLCPGPLIIYEEFFKNFGLKKKVSNLFLSRLILNSLHPFYKTFKLCSENNNIFIYKDKNSNSLIFNNFHLHIAILSLKIKNIRIEKSYDEDLILNSELKNDEIDYLNYSHEGIIITLEDYFSERSIRSTELASTIKAKNFQEHFRIPNRLFDKSTHISYKRNYIKGTFVVSTKVNPFKIKKKFDTILIGKILNFLKKDKNYLKKNNLLDAIDNTNYEIIHQKDESLDLEFAVKGFKEFLKKEKILSKIFLVFLFFFILLMPSQFLLYLYERYIYNYKSKNIIKNRENFIYRYLRERKVLFILLLDNKKFIFKYLLFFNKKNI